MKIWMLLLELLGVKAVGLDLRPCDEGPVHPGLGDLVGFEQGQQSLSGMGHERFSFLLELLTCEVEVDGLLEACPRRGIDRAVA